MIQTARRSACLILHNRNIQKVQYSVLCALRCTVRSARILLADIMFPTWWFPATQLSAARGTAAPYSIVSEMTDAEYRLAIICGTRPIWGPVRRITCKCVLLLSSPVADVTVCRSKPSGLEQSRVSIRRGAMSKVAVVIRCSLRCY